MRDLIDTKMNSIDKRFELVTVVLYVSVIAVIAILALLFIETAA